MNTKKIVLIATAFLWIIIALSLIASKQQTLTKGRKVLLETVPVDPRDFLRGDYVILNYKISSLDLKSMPTDKSGYRGGDVVYVCLIPSGKFWTAGELACRKDKFASSGSVYIKGRVRSAYSGKLNVEYGIESYFVPEGKGVEIERNMRGRGPTKVSVEASIDAQGNAVIHKVYINDQEVK